MDLTPDAPSRSKVNVPVEGQRSPFALKAHDIHSPGQRPGYRLKQSQALKGRHTESGNSISADPCRKARRAAISIAQVGLEIRSPSGAAYSLVPHDAASYLASGPTALSFRSASHFQRERQRTAALQDLRTPQQCFRPWILRTIPHGQSLRIGNHFQAPTTPSGVPASGGAEGVCPSRRAIARGRDTPLVPTDYSCGYTSTRS